MEPHLATLVAEPPEGDEWLHEPKFDGYRILCRVEGGAARLSSRNGKDWTERFPQIARAAAALPVQSALLDGEVAVLMPDGMTSFAALQRAAAPADGGEVVYFVFDLITSNLRVAQDVLRPIRVLRPGIIAVPLDAQTDLEITVLVNFIMLTPGTLALDVSADRSEIFIHVMNAENPEQVRAQIKDGFERRVLGVLR